MKDLTCIVCPRGCRLHIDDNNVVTGNFCPRGAKYALDELSNPKRMITSILRVKNRDNMMVSVKTENSIPKGMIFAILEEIKKVEINAPIHIGQVVIKDVLGTGVDIVATKEIE